MRQVNPDAVIAPLDDAGAASAFARAVLFLFAIAIPLDVVPMFGGTASVAFFSGMLLAAGSLWHVVTSGRLRAAPAALLLLTAYTAWALASVLWAHDTEAALRRSTTNVQLVVFVWLAWQIATSRAELGLMAGGFVAGSAIASVGAWRAFLTGVTYDQTRPDWAQYQDARYVALGFDPNDMGVTMAIAMPMAAWLVLRGVSRWRWLWLGYLPLGVGAVALSGSRGAILAAAVAMPCVLFVLARRSRAATAAVALVLLVVLAVLSVRTPETFDRILTVRQQLAGGTMTGRVQIWRAGFELFLADPVAGLGTGQFRASVGPVLGYSIDAHNAFLSVLVELGLVGLALFAGAFASLFRSALRAASIERLLAVSLLATWVVGVSSLTWELRKTTWFVALLCAVAAQLPAARRDPASDAAGRG